MRKKPGTLELGVGRLDLQGSSEGEIEGLRRYFARNHEFRTGQSGVELPAQFEREKWITYSLDMGSTLGFAQRLSWNSGKTEALLLGDPTLRARTIAPPVEARWSKGVGAVGFVTWKRSASQGVGSYWIYHAGTRDPREDPGFRKVGQSPSDRPYFLHKDGFIEGKPHFYWVRSVRLEKTPSGTYVNISPLVPAPFGDPHAKSP
jgi:hypothetical protein